MKGRKRLGRKKRRKGLSKKESMYGILLAVVIVSLLFIYFSLRSPLNQASGKFQFKAAIVDHLSFLQQPNPTFIETATTILEEAKFTVDYYPGESVTVKFYRKLATHGYGLIILRVHSAIDPNTTALALFTSELYNKNDHLSEQIAGQVGGAQISPENPIYFGVGPLFVLQCMEGSFHDTIIIMMGCDGLLPEYTQMAEAFIGKGAKVYVSWNGPVLTSHTDQATIQLLEHLMTKKRTIKQAVTETMNEVGPDPVDGSELLYYPPEAENYVIPETQSNLTTNVAETNPKIENLKDVALPWQKSEKTSIK